MNQQGWKQVDEIMTLKRKQHYSDVLLSISNPQWPQKSQSLSKNILKVKMKSKSYLVLL